MPMRLDPEIRKRLVVPLLAGMVLAVYAFGFLPLGGKSARLAGPLGQSWRQLASALGRTNATELDFVSITNQLAATRDAVAVVEAVRKQSRSRVELDASIRAQLEQPFLLVDYRYEAGQRMNALAQLARKQSVTLDPAVLAGFPEQSVDMKEPSLLWVQFAFLDGLLTSAINARVTGIQSIAAPLPWTNAPYASAGRSLVELPLQIELSGPTASVTRFLQTLPLRADEIKAAGLPESTTNKPALFIDRLVLRKQSPEKPDEVHLSLRAVGFLFSR